MPTTLQFASLITPAHVRIHTASSLGTLPPCCACHHASSVDACDAGTYSHHIEVAAPLLLGATAFCLSIQSHFESAAVHGKCAGAIVRQHADVHLIHANTSRMHTASSSPPAALLLARNVMPDASEATLLCAGVL